MELVRKFNIEIDTTDVVKAINNYIDKTVQKSSNSYVKFDNLTARETACIYKQLGTVLTNEYKRLVEESSKQTATSKE